MRASKKVFARLTAVSALALALQTGLSGQQEEVVAHSVSVNDKSATVTFELANGREISLSVGNSILTTSGAEVAELHLASGAEQAWRETLAQAGKLSTAELLDAIREWERNQTGDVTETLATTLRSLNVTDDLPAEMVAESSEASQREALAEAQQHREHTGLVIDLSQIGERQRGLAVQLDEVRERLERINNLELNVENARINMGDITVPNDQTIDNDLVVLAGDVSVFGNVDGNVIALDGDVILHQGGSIGKDVVTFNGQFIQAGGTLHGRAQSGEVKLRLRQVPPAPPKRLVSPVSKGTSLLSLLGMFVALSCIGFGFTFFAPRQLDIVSDTVSESFGKSFFAGLFATPLVPPLFVISLIGLALTVVGIILLPFAIVGGILAIMAAATGGYLAVAKSVGSTYLNRRIAQGHALVATPYKSLIYGLVGLMAIWLPAALLGWIPVIGPALAMLAAIFTWVMVTAGFGAAILSRAGIRATFVSAQRASALTDEHYWPMDTGSHSIPSRSPRRSD